MKPEEKGPVHSITPNGSTALTIHPIPRDLLLQSVAFEKSISKEIKYIPIYNDNEED